MLESVPMATWSVPNNFGKSRNSSGHYDLIVVLGLAFKAVKRYAFWPDVTEPSKAAYGSPVATLDDTGRPAHLVRAEDAHW